MRPGDRTLYKMCFLLIRCASVLVPASRRRDWRAEWEAELIHAWCPSRGPALLRRCLGVFPDGLHLLVAHWSVLLTEECWVESGRALLASPGALVLRTVALGILLGTLAGLVSVTPVSIPAISSDGPPKRWVQIQSAYPVVGTDLRPFSELELHMIETSATTLDGVSAFRMKAGALEAVGPRRQMHESTDHEMPESATRLSVGIVEISSDAAREFQATVVGRSLCNDDYGSAAAMVISEDLWIESFSGRSDITDLSLDLDGQERRIVGVVKARRPLDDLAMSVWIPLLEPNVLQTSGPLHVGTGGGNGASGGRRNTTNRDLSLLARLAPGATAQDARNEVAAILGSTSEYEPRAAGVSVDEIDPRAPVSAWPIASPPLSLALVCGFLILVLLARGSRWLDGVHGPERWSRSSLTVGLVCLFAIPVVSEVCAALQVLRGQLYRGSGEGSAMSGGGSGLALLGGLLFLALVGPRTFESSRWVRRIPAQRVLSGVVLVSCTIILHFAYRSDAMLRVLDREDLIAVELLPREPSEANRAWVVDRASSIPGVMAASLMSPGPLQGVAGGTIVKATPTSTGIDVGYRYVDSRYVSVMLDRAVSDLGKDGVLVNETLARTLFPAQGAVGRPIYGIAPNCAPVFVAGVVADLPQDEPLGRVAPEVLLGFSYAEEYGLSPSSWTLLAQVDRTADVRQVKERLQSIYELDLRTIVTRVSLLESTHAEAQTQPRASARLAGLGIALALAIAGLGIGRQPPAGTSPPLD